MMNKILFTFYIEFLIKIWKLETVQCEPTGRVGAIVCFRSDKPAESHLILLFDYLRARFMIEPRSFGE